MSKSTLCLPFSIYHFYPSTLRRKSNVLSCLVIGVKTPPGINHTSTKHSYDLIEVVDNRDLEMLFESGILFPSFVVGFVIGHHFRLWYRLRHIRGPFLASILDIWMLHSVLSGRNWRDLGDL